MAEEKDKKYFFKDQILPNLRILETKRKTIANRIYITLAVIAAVILLLFFVVGNNPGVLIFAGLIALGVFLFMYKGMTREYVSEFKREIIARLVKYINDNLNYKAYQCIPEHTFRGSGIFHQKPDRYKGDDFVSGKIGQTEIEFSEIHAEYKTESVDSKGRRHTHWHTIFKGLFFIADFHKHFKGVTYVLPDTAEKYLGFLGKKLQEMNISRKQKLVKMEDPEFEKLFVVYGDDQIETRYILSPSLIKRITEYKKNTGRVIYLCFRESKVYVAISYVKDLFEPRIFRTLLDFGMINEYLKDFQTAVDIVESLNLNTRIWSKN